MCLFVIISILVARTFTSKKKESWKMRDIKTCAIEIVPFFLSNPPNAWSIRSPRREGDQITKNLTDMDYHNTYIVRVPQKSKTGHNRRVWRWLSMTVRVKGILQELSEICQI